MRVGLIALDLVHMLWNESKEALKWRNVYSTPECHLTLWVASQRDHLLVNYFSCAVLYSYFIDLPAYIIIYQRESGSQFRSRSGVDGGIKIVIDRAALEVLRGGTCEVGWKWEAIPRKLNFMCSTSCFFWRSWWDVWKVPLDGSQHGQHFGCLGWCFLGQQSQKNSFFFPHLLHKSNFKGIC